MSATTVSVSFKYELLCDQAAMAQENAAAIRRLLNTTTRQIVEIGRRLIAVHDAIGGELFGYWLRFEFQWGQSTASNYMQVARKFGELDCLEQFDAGALYELARGRVDEDAVEEAIAKARRGETITRKAAKTIVEKYIPAGEPVPKPDAFYKLRTSLKQLGERLDQLATSVPETELHALADQLLEVALRLRSLHSPAAASRPAARRAPSKRAVAGAA